ncbi:MAG: hypothetical protein CL608_04715 [Anaerolineaceae bacterium]|nr:hypothetical protein [Anaerolineaceae bacterium]
MSGVSYYQTGTAWDKLIGRKVENRRWFDPNQSYKKSFLAKLKLTNFDVSDFLYSTIKGIIKNAYSVSYGSKQVELVELHLEFNDRYGEIFKTFKAIDGNYIYDLLNHGLKNDGKLSLDPTQPLKRDSNAEVIRMIKALAELRDAGILTNSEYEIKKSQLLDRL